MIRRGGARRFRLRAGRRQHGAVTDTARKPAPRAEKGHRDTTLQGFALYAALMSLALGGFAIGTTEFVTMGLLPQIADGVRVGIPQAGHIVSAYALGVVVGRRRS